MTIPLAHHRKELARNELKACNLEFSAPILLSFWSTPPLKPAGSKYSKLRAAGLWA